MDSFIEFQNKLDEVARITCFVEEIGEVLQLRPALINSLQLAIEEAVVNVINYAYAEGVNGNACLSAHYEGNKLTFSLTDSGTPFDPTAKIDPNIHASVEERPIGGLGILLIKKIMDEVSYRYVDEKNTLIMTKSI